MTKNVATKTWTLPAVAGRRYSAGAPSGGDGNFGTVGSYAALDLSAHPIYTVDMSHEDYSVFATGGGEGFPGTGTDTHNASGWPEGGGAYCRITPPTTDGYERGIALEDLWQGATLSIQNFQYRYQTRFSANFASMLGTGSKYGIIHTRRTFTVGDSDDRPAIFLTKLNTADNPSFNRANTFVIGPSQETTNGWGPNPYGDTYEVDLWYYPNSVLPFYLTNTGDTGTFNSNPLIPAGEVIEIEHKIITITTPEFSRGLIGFRLYRSNGQSFQSAIPWNWDETVPFGAFVDSVQQFGCGQFNTAPGANFEYVDIGTYFTVARDFDGWLGPTFGITPP